MSGSVRWGVLSTARINEKVLAGARAAEHVEVLAVASRSEASATAYAREHAIERAHGSYEALLGDPDIEAVYVSLPNSLHAEWTVRALEAGKHVLCEKPLSRRSAEAQRAFDVAERSERLLMEAFMYRHNPQTARLVALIGEGAIGRLRVVRASFSFHLDDESNVRLSRELEGGSLMDVGCYCVNVARLLCGEPERVHGELLLGSSGVDVAFAGVLGFADDVLAHFDCGLVLSPRDELVVLGEQGSLHLADPWHCITPGIELRRLPAPRTGRSPAMGGSGGSESIPIEPADSYGLELENFSAAIRGTAAPLLGREDALGQARTIEALYASADEGRTVTLSGGAPAQT